LSVILKKFMIMRASVRGAPALDPGGLYDLHELALASGTRRSDDPGPIGEWRRVYSRGEGGDLQASKHNFQETHNPHNLLLSVQLCWEVPMNDEEIRFKDIGIQQT
jgi:N-acetyl-anhydromuramyl-L-alanine amidase AmpD